MQPVINKAISYIFDHLDEDITVDDVARHCSYSKYHLTRCSKRILMRHYISSSSEYD